MFSSCFFLLFFPKSSTIYTPVCFMLSSDPLFSLLPGFFLFFFNFIFCDKVSPCYTDWPKVLGLGQHLCLSLPSNWNYRWAPSYLITDFLPKRSQLIILNSPPHPTDNIKRQSTSLRNTIYSAISIPLVFTGPNEPMG